MLNLRKRVCAIVLSVVMCLSLLPMSASAFYGTKDWKELRYGVIDPLETPLTEEAPDLSGETVTLTKAEHFIYFLQHLSEFEGRKVTTNGGKFDLGGYTFEPPLNYYTMAADTTFDGNGATISNFCIDLSPADKTYFTQPAQAAILRTDIVANWLSSSKGASSFNRPGLLVNGTIQNVTFENFETTDGFWELANSNQQWFSATVAFGIGETGCMSNVTFSKGITYAVPHISDDAPSSLVYVAEGGKLLDATIDSCYLTGKFMCVVDNCGTVTNLDMNNTIIRDGMSRGEDTGTYVGYVNILRGSGEWTDVLLTRCGFLSQSGCEVINLQGTKEHIAAQQAQIKSVNGLYIMDRIVSISDGDTSRNMYAQQNKRTTPEYTESNQVVHVANNGGVDIGPGPKVYFVGNNKTGLGTGVVNAQLWLVSHNAEEGTSFIFAGTNPALKANNEIMMKDGGMRFKSGSDIMVRAFTRCTTTDENDGNGNSTWGWSYRVNGITFVLPEDMWVTQNESGRYVMTNDKGEAYEISADENGKVLLGGLDVKTTSKNSYMRYHYEENGLSATDTDGVFKKTLKNTDYTGWLTADMTTIYSASESIHDYVYDAIPVLEEGEELAEGELPAVTTNQMIKHTATGRNYTQNDAAPLDPRMTAENTDVETWEWEPTDATGTPKQQTVRKETDNKTFALVENAETGEKTNEVATWHHRLWTLEREDYHYDTEDETKTYKRNVSAETTVDDYAWSEDSAKLNKTTHQHNIATYRYDDSPTANRYATVDVVTTYADDETVEEEVETLTNPKYITINDQLTYWTNETTKTTKSIPEGGGEPIVTKISSTTWEPIMNADETQRTGAIRYEVTKTLLEGKDEPEITELVTYYTNSADGVTTNRTTTESIPEGKAERIVTNVTSTVTEPIKNEAGTANIGTKKVEETQSIPEGKDAAEVTYRKTTTNQTVDGVNTVVEMVESIPEGKTALEVTYRKTVTSGVPIMEENVKVGTMKTTVEEDMRDIPVGTDGATESKLTIVFKQEREDYINTVHSSRETPIIREWYYDEELHDLGDVIRTGTIRTINTPSASADLINGWLKESSGNPDAAYFYTRDVHDVTYTNDKVTHVKDYVQWSNYNTGKYIYNAIVTDTDTFYPEEEGGEPWTLTSKVVYRPNTNGTLDYVTYTGKDANGVEYNFTETQVYNWPDTGRAGVKTVGVKKGVEVDELVVKDWTYTETLPTGQTRTYTVGVTYSPADADEPIETRIVSDVTTAAREGYAILYPRVERSVTYRGNAVQMVETTNAEGETVMTLGRALKSDEEIEALLAEGKLSVVNSTYKTAEYDAESGSKSSVSEDKITTVIGEDGEPQTVVSTKNDTVDQNGRYTGYTQTTENEQTGEKTEVKQERDPDKRSSTTTTLNTGSEGEVTSVYQTNDELNQVTKTTEYDNNAAVLPDAEREATVPVKETLTQPTENGTTSTTVSEGYVVLDENAEKPEEKFAPTKVVETETKNNSVVKTTDSTYETVETDGKTEVVKVQENVTTPRTDGTSGENKSETTIDKDTGAATTTTYSTVNTTKEVPVVDEVTGEPTGEMKTVTELVKDPTATTTETQTERVVNKDGSVSNKTVSEKVTTPKTDEEGNLFVDEVTGEPTGESSVTETIYNKDNSTTKTEYTATQTLNEAGEIVTAIDTSVPAVKTETARDGSEVKTVYTPDENGNIDTTKDYVVQSKDENGTDVTTVVTTDPESGKVTEKTYAGTFENPEEVPENAPVTEMKVTETTKDGGKKESVYNADQIDETGELKPDAQPSSETTSSESGESVKEIKDPVTNKVIETVVTKTETDEAGNTTTTETVYEGSKDEIADKEPKKETVTTETDTGTTTTETDYVNNTTTETTSNYDGTSQQDVYNGTGEDKAENPSQTTTVDQNDDGTFTQKTEEKDPDTGTIVKESTQTLDDKGQPQKDENGNVVDPVETYNKPTLNFGTEGTADDQKTKVLGDNAEVTFAEDNKSITVKNDVPCVVYAKLADGSYKRLEGTKGEDNKYTFDVAGQVSGGYSLEVVKKGDITGDGTVEITDITKLIRAKAQKSDLTEREKAMSDVNGDGVIDLSDITALIRCKSATAAKPMDW